MTIKISDHLKASSSRSGRVIIATTGEANNGSDTSKVITPATLKFKVESYTKSKQEIDDGLSSLSGAYLGKSATASNSLKLGNDPAIDFMKFDDLSDSVSSPPVDSNPPSSQRATNSAYTKAAQGVANAANALQKANDAQGTADGKSDSDHIHRIDRSRSNLATGWIKIADGNGMSSNIFNIVDTATGKLDMVSIQCDMNQTTGNINVIGRGVSGASFKNIRIRKDASNPSSANYILEIEVNHAGSNINVSMQNGDNSASFGDWNPITPIASPLSGYTTYLNVSLNGSIGFLTSGMIRANGKIVAGGDVEAFSDVSLKEDIITVNNSLDLIGKLRGVFFKWKESQELSSGVIAQEVEKVVPRLVRKDEFNGNEVKTVNHNGFTGLFIEGFKSLSLMFSSLSTRQDDLEKTVELLKAEIEELKLK